MSFIVFLRHTVAFSHTIMFLSRKGTNRYLTIRKKDGGDTNGALMTCCLTHNTKHIMRDLVQRFPISNKEKTELLPKTERSNVFAVEAGALPV